MNKAKSRAERLAESWLDFWFPGPPLENLALMRIGVGALVVYVLILRSYDLEAMFSVMGFSRVAGSRNPTGWPLLSIFDWVDGAGWLWTVHIGAMVSALAFILGLFPRVTGLAVLLIHLSYGQRNPAVTLGLDSLISLALFYLILSPCGKKLSLFRLPEPPAPLRPSLTREEPEPPRFPWGGLAPRILQIHLCLLYFQSGLAKLGGEWLAGSALLHPRLEETGPAIGAETLQANPELLTLIPFGLALVELFFPVFIWLPRFRYVALATVAAMHLAAGVGWDKLPFNLLAIVLILVFIPSGPLERLFGRAGELFSYYRAKASSARTEDGGPV